MLCAIQLFPCTYSSHHSAVSAVMFLEAVALVALILLIFAITSGGKDRSKNGLPLPPEPCGLPILGHLLFLGQYPQKTLLKWGRNYGPIFCVRFGSLHTVVINDGQLIRKAFSSAAFAGRPRIKVFDEISKRKGIAFADGPGAMEQRQFTFRSLKDYTSQGMSVESRVLTEVDSLLSHIDSNVNKPIKVTNFYYRSIVNAILSILFSKKFEPDDPRVNEFAQLINTGLKIDGIIENLGIFIPKLAEWLPKLVGHHKRVAVSRQVQQFLQDLIDEHRETFVKGQPRDITDAYLELSEDTTDPLSSFHSDAGNLLGNLFDLFIAGSDTTSSSLEWVTYYLVKHPQVQEKLQEEIDVIIGQERSPSLNDRPQLVYTEAVIYEVLRIASVVPLGAFHRALEDEAFNGYMIPKDTMIVSNIYAAHHDPLVWKDPESFRPERFIGADGKIQDVDKFIAFSAGKRDCIGKAFARNQLLLYLTSIMQNYNVKLVGKLAPPDGFGITVVPKPFQVIFTKRNND